VSPGGRVVISRYDGVYHDLVNNPLAEGMPFHSGLGQANVFGVLACGPSLTFLLNNWVVTGLPVEPAYAEGYLGLYVHHAATSPHAELAADWIQVRAIFPGQQER